MSTTIHSYHGSATEVAALNELSQEPAWDFSRHGLAELCAQPAIALWYATAEEQPQAWLGLIVSQDSGVGEGEILYLFVRPQARRQGLGQKLLQVFLAHAPATVFAEVRVSNHPARTLYASNGFREVGCRRQYYRAKEGLPAEDALVLKRELHADEKTILT